MHATESVKGPCFTFTLEETMLDYVLIDEGLVRQLRYYEILDEGSVSSTYDHLPVTVSISLEENPHKLRDSFMKSPSWHRITENNIANYRLNLSEPIESLIDNVNNNCVNIDSFYEQFVVILRNAADSAIPSTSYNPYTKPYWNGDVKTAHNKERDMRKKWVQEGRPRGMNRESYCNYKRAKRDFRNTQQAAQEQYIEETYSDMNEAAECDIILFWKMIKRQRPKKSKIYPEIIHEGVLNDKPETVANAFAN